VTSAMTTTGDCDPDALELRSDYAVLKAVGRGAAASASVVRDDDGKNQVS
jgi:hypothetical protein